MRQPFKFAPRVGSRRAGALLALLCLVPPCAAFLLSTGTLNGTVKDTAGAAVENANVTATHRTSGRAESRLTNNQGFYEFAELRRGQYNVTVVSPGFLDGEREDVTVRLGQTTTEDFTLQPGQMASLRGVVRDARGRGVVGATVTALNLDTNRAFTSLTKRDQRGEYFLRLPAGRYDVSVSAPKFDALTEKGVELPANRERELNFTFAPKPQRAP